MRITLLLNRDLPSNLAFNLLLPRLKDHHLTLFLSDQVGRPDQAKPQELVDLKFLEQDLVNAFYFPLLETKALSFRQELLTFEQLAFDHAFPMASLNRPNSPQGLETLRESQPDLILSIRYGKILKNPAIAIPAHGVLNLHSGLLPAYRGVLATFRALMAGDSEIGCTLHYISDATIDTGPILSRATVPVERSKSLFWHVLRLYPPGVKLMAEAVDTIATGGTPDLEAPASQEGAYFSYPTDEEFAAFREMGFKISCGQEMTELLARYMPS